MEQDLINRPDVLIVLLQAVSSVALFLGGILMTRLFRSVVEMEKKIAEMNTNQAVHHTRLKHLEGAS